MAANPNRKPANKQIRVMRVRKVLHIGLDLAAAPWAGALIQAMPGNIEHHGTHIDDATASLLQLHRPRFPELTPRAGLSAMNRMARIMRNYELVLVHGDHAFPATMAHTLFGQALKLPPLIHFHQGVGAVPSGQWARFRHKLGMARTSSIVVPTQAAARSVADDWHVPVARIHILPPVFPRAAALPPKADAIPRMLKRAGEKWIGMRASDAAFLPANFLARFADLEESWHLVVFGSEAETAKARSAADAAGFAHRLHVTSRLQGPGVVGGLFDLAMVNGTDGKIPPDLPSLMAAGVPVVAVSPAGLGELLPPESRDFRIDVAALDSLAILVQRLTQSDEIRIAAGRANAGFAARRADAGPHLSLLAQVLDLPSLEDR